MKCKCLIAILLIATKLGAIAQSSNYPKIGRPIPDFTLTNIQHYMGGEITAQKIKGKFVILDLFSRNCSSCFASFPLINALQKQFSGKVQFILVGQSGQDLYEKFKKKYRLELAVVFDTLLFDQFKVTGVPKEYWIDDKGIVKAITSTDDVTKKNIDLFLAGKPFTVSDWSFDMHEARASNYDYHKPLLIDGNAGTDSDFLYRSVLSPWKRTTDFEMRVIKDNLIDGVSLEGRKGYQATCISLKSLYQVAYTGSPFWNGLDGDTVYGHWGIDIQVKDSSRFVGNFATGENYYDYSLIAPVSKVTIKYIMSVMQTDLRNYFDYDITVERKNMPYWAITLTNEGRIKLKSKGMPLSFTGDYAGFKATNWPFKTLVNRTTSTFNSDTYPIIDESHMLDNIDIEINVPFIYSNFVQVKKELARQGILLIKKYKPMNVIVIRDKHPF